MPDEQEARKRCVSLQIFHGGERSAPLQSIFTTAAVMEMQTQLPRWIGCQKPVVSF